MPKKANTTKITQKKVFYYPVTRKVFKRSSTKTLINTVKMAEIEEIRVHGRGGQGAVTFAQLLAIAGFYEGFETQAFPKFGVERRGAPVEAYCRVSKKQINLRDQVYNPKLIIILDSSLMDTVDVCHGLEKGGLIIINTSEEIPKNMFKDFKVFNVDATHVALSIFGADIVNTAMLGAYAAVTGKLSIKSINKSLEERFKRRSDLIEKNKKAVEEVYNLVKKNMHANHN